MLTIQNDNNGIWLMVISQASVCGRRAEKVERRRRDGGNSRSATPSPSRRRKPALLRPIRMPLVTGARLVKRSAANRALVTADNHLNLHGDGLLIFQGGANKSPHLGAIATQFCFEFAAGQMNFF